MKQIVLAAALVAATAPAQARWAYRTVTVRVWVPDSPRHVRANELAELCQDRLRRSEPLPPTWMEAVTASRDREIRCRWGLR